MNGAPRDGKIVTFYSYKGGTGRSMALANVGWILAATGRRVLLIDWDLEAPGLHRYLHPFLSDKELTSTPGLMDFFIDFAAGARIERTHAETNATWFEPLASLVRYTSPVEWDFGSGALELVGAGRQDAGYGVGVTNYNWATFYEEMGGGVFLEALKKRLRHDYDFVLIDSRTGISDTSGICTVQMPDELVVLFTMNQQSIKGAASIAATADQLRRKKSGEPGLRIWPVPTRVELAEKDRLDAARDEARATFDWYVGHLSRGERSAYWGDMEVLYQPYYAYEEVLATFADRPRQPNTLLAKMEAIARRIVGGPVALPLMPEAQRLETRARFERAKKPEEVVAPASASYAFISYSSADEAMARSISQALRAAGMATWFYAENIRPGDIWQEVIRAAIAGCSVFIALFNRMGTSEWRGIELETALTAGKRVLPVLVGDATVAALPPKMREIHAARMRSDADVEWLVGTMPFFLDRQSTALATFDPEDPQKGRWGGEAARYGRVLSAEVRPISEAYFAITLHVRSTGGEPLEGEVTFHLHPTFQPSIRTERVVNGEAVLELMGWGAFTVGAEADGGHTRLELDLARDPRFPATFRER